MDALTSLHFKTEYGQGHVFELPTSAAVDPEDKHGVSGRHRGRRLFGDDVTHNQLLGMVLDGWRTKTTGLTEAFGFDEYRSQYKRGCVPLFALDPSDRLWLFTAEDSWQPEAGWRVVSLVNDQIVSNE